MGANIEFFHPRVLKPEEYYNFNWADRVEGYYQGIRIHGPTKLHNAVLSIDDLRGGRLLFWLRLWLRRKLYSWS